MPFTRSRHEAVTQTVSIVHGDSKYEKVLNLQFCVTVRSSQQDITGSGLHNPQEIIDIKIHISNFPTPEREKF